MGGRESMYQAEVFVWRVGSRRGRETEREGEREGGREGRRV